jgi:hypothetical protein
MLSGLQQPQAAPQRTATIPRPKTIIAQPHAPAKETAARRGGRPDPVGGPNPRLHAVLFETLSPGQARALLLFFDIADENQPRLDCNRLLLNRIAVATEGIPQ